MASEKTASVKLSLNSSSYVSAIKDVGKETEKTTQKMESSFKKSMVAGLKSVQRATGEMAASVKNTIRLVGGLGGALSLAESVKGAIDLRGEFKKLAFQAQAGSGEVVNWRDILQGAQEQAVKWGLATEELGHAFGTMRTITGDLGFAKESLAAVAVTARATGEPLDLIADIAGKMNEKFAVTAKEMPEALATAYSLAQQGSLEFGEMAMIIERAGSSAKFLGISGVGGIAKVVGMAKLAKGETKNLRSALSGTMALMEQLGSSEGAKKVAQDFGVVIKKGQTFEQTLGKIMKRTGGKENLLVKGFQGEQLKVVMELAKVYRAAFEGTSGTVEQKTKAALAAFQSHLDEAGKTMIHAADIQAKAADVVKGPAAQMAIAIEELKTKFTSPEMLDGLTKLATVAPKAAKTVASLMDLAFNHPALAAGIFAGIKLGVPFLEGALKSGGESIAKSMLNIVKGNGPGGVGGALGKGAAVLGAGVAGFAVGEVAAEAIDRYSVAPNQKDTASLIGATAAADINTTGKIDKGAATASLSELRKRLDKAKEEHEFSGWDIASLGLRRLGTASSEDIAKGEATYARGRKALDDSLGPSAEKAGDKLDDFATSLDGAARKINDLLTGGGAGGAGPPRGGSAHRGPPRATPPGPGYAPRVNG